MPSKKLRNDIKQVLQIIKNDKPQQDYFFNELSKNHNPTPFLFVLKDYNYFAPENNPNMEEVADKPNYFTVPKWNVLDYLENVARINEKDNYKKRKVTDTLFEIINSWIDYKSPSGVRIENYRTDWTIIKIISTLPIKKITDKHIKFVKVAMSSKFEFTPLYSEIGKSLIPKIILNKALFLQLLDVLLEYKMNIERDFTNTMDLKEYHSIMNEYWLKDILVKHKSSIAKLYSVEASKIALKKISEILREDNSQFNYIWIPTIEDHTQKTFTEKYEVQIVDFLRDMLEQSEPSRIKVTVKKLIRNMHSIFKRLAVHIINYHYEELNDIFWNYKGNIISQPFIKHEVYVLLQQRSHLFTPNQINQLLYWIKNKDFHFRSEVKKDREKMLKLEAYGKREWLLPLLPLNIVKVKKLYNELEKIDNTHIEHPGFYSWSSSYSGYMSPITLDDLSNKSIDQIAELLQEYKSDNAFMSHSKEGLASNLQAIVMTNPLEYSRNIKAFLNVPKIYQHSVLTGLLESQRSLKSIEWKEVLEFSLEIINEPNFWEHDENKPYNYHNWIVSMISDLIIIGCRQYPPVIQPSLLPRLQKLLLILLNKTKPDIKSSIGLPTRVLNSTRGKVLSASMIFSIIYARDINEGKTLNKWNNEIKKYFDERILVENDSSIELRFILGQYLTDLYYSLANRWVMRNIDKIFDKDNQVNWLCATTGYLFYTNPIYRELYELLKEHNHYPKMIKTVYVDNEINDKVVEHVAITYIEGLEKIDEPTSLISILLENKNKKQLSYLIRYFWMLRDQKTNNINLAIKPLWNALYHQLLQSVDKRDTQLLLSDLCKWVSLIDEIDDDALEWIKLSSRYAELNYNAPFLIESLAQHVQETPEKVAVIFLEMLNAGNYPDYDETHIQQIVNELYITNYKAEANQIFNIYFQKGYIFLRDLYDRYNSEI